MARGAFAKSLINMMEKAGIQPNTDAAKKLNFDTGTTWYHGNNVDQMQSIDPSRFGAATETPASKEAFFLTSSKENAQGFAENAAKKGGDPSLHEMWYRPQKTASVDWAEYGGGVPIRSNNGQRMLAGLLQDAKENGLSGVRIKNSGDSLTDNQDAGDVLAVLNPSLLRYKNAAFDPTKKDSSNLLAGAATIGGVSGLAALAPRKSFADSLHDVVMSAKPTTREIMDAQVRREKYLAEIETINKQNKSIQAPVSNMAAKAADLAGQYNKYRKENLHPLADTVLPVGELPEEFYRKLSYGEKVTMSDRVKAGMGLL